MPLLMVPGWRCGDSLPAELRTGVWQFQGTDQMPSLRLAKGQHGLSGESIWYGSRMQRGLAGLGQTPCDQATIDAINAGGIDPTSVACDPSLPPSYTPPYPVGGGGIPCMPDCYPGALAQGQVYCDSGSTIPASCGTASTPGTTTYGSTSATVNSASCPGVLVVNSQGAYCVQGAAAPTGTNLPRAIPAGQQVPATQLPPGYQWANVIGPAGQALGQILAISQGQGVQTLPNGAQVVYPKGTQAAVAGTIGFGPTGQPVSQQQANQALQQAGFFTAANMPMILMIGAAVVLMFMMSQQRGS